MTLHPEEGVAHMNETSSRQSNMNVSLFDIRIKSPARKVFSDHFA